MTLTQGPDCGVNKRKSACLRDKVRITHWISTKRGSVVALAMVITGSCIGEILLKAVILANFLLKFRMFRKSSFKFLAIYDFSNIGQMTSFQLLPESREIPWYVQS